MSESYTGVPLLESLECAVNYNGHIADIVAQSFSTKNVVDYGAGTGTFARLLQKRDFNVTCVEPDVHLNQQLQQSGFKTQTQLAHLTPPIEGLYSINVLEHIYDDVAAVAEMHQRLAPHGTVVIYVPAFNHLYSSVDKKIGHHRRYTLRTLSALFKDFKILRLEYVDSVGYFAGLAFKHLFPNSETVSEKSIQLFDTYAFPLSKILDKTTHQLFGKNVLLVAQKQ